MILRILYIILVLYVFKVNCTEYFEDSIIYGISQIASSGSNRCGQEFKLFKNALDNKEPWAVKMFDASGSPSSGFTYGNNMWIGSPFQCRDIQNRKRFELNHRKTENRINAECDFPPFPLAFTKIHMRHNSSLQINTNMPLDKYIQLGLCLPKSCEIYHITNLLEWYFEKGKNFPFRNFYNSSITVLNVKVLREDSTWIFNEFKTMALLFLTAPCVFFVILATFIDIRYYKDDIQVVKSRGSLTKRNKNNERHANELSMVIYYLTRNCRLIRCFSLKKNLYSLLNTSLSKNSVPALHGLRFFGMIWIINVHSIFFGIDYFTNVPQGFRLGEIFLFQVYSNSSYCVDTFFFISGFILAYLFYTKKYEEMFLPTQFALTTKIAEYFLLYANRLLRLIYPYLITILVTDVLFTYFRETSALHSSECPDITCSKFCWRNILFINNLYPRSEMCMSWSWYLSIDSQFFLIATFLLVLSTIYFKITVCLIVSLIFGVMIITSLTCYEIGYIPTMDDQLRELDAIYDLPWNRMGPYLVGIIFGYVLVITLKGQLKLTRCKLVTCWVIFPSVNLCIIFGIYGRQISEKVSAIYMGISRTFWGLGVGWILVACSTNNGGIVNKFLSYPAWIPLSKLTYCVYLLNPLIANTLYLLSDTPFHLTASQTVFSVSGVTIMTFAVAFVFCLFFELPMVSLTKLLLDKVSKLKKKTS